MVIRVNSESAENKFLNLLSGNRLISGENLSLKQEADLLLSRVRYAFAKSNITEASRDRILTSFNYAGAVECSVSLADFRELAAPENRELLRAAIAVEVEKKGGNPDATSLFVKASPIFSAVPFIGRLFEKALVNLPSHDVAIMLCRPNSPQAENLKELTHA